MSALLELAARVEAASGADRELDVAVFRAIGAPVPFQFANQMVPLVYDETEQCYFAPVGDMRVRYEPPAYTASLDAAMSLVTGYCTLISLSEIAADGLPLARVARPDLDGAPIFIGCAFGIKLGTPLTTQLALALTAACLRALARGTS